MHKQISWWCGLFALLMCGMGCAGSEPASPSSVASEDAGNIVDDAGDEQADTSGDDTGGQDSSDEDTGSEDTSSEDTSPEDEPDAVDDCGCEVGEICISNDTVEDACFPRDCPGEQCDSGFVCMDGACVSVPCAGVDCGGYPNVCRGGVCQVGNCSDPDVSCPAGQQCISNDCLTICTSQEECTPLACIDGFCRPCSEDVDCGDGLLCVAEQCVEPCTDDPDVCDEEQVCNPSTGLCVPPCDEDADCPSGQICDASVELCLPQECDETMLGECPEGEQCAAGRCIGLRARFAAGLCSGCERMSSPRYQAIAVLSPVEIVSGTSSTGRYQLQSGTVMVLRDEEEDD